MGLEQLPLSLVLELVMGAALATRGIRDMHAPPPPTTVADMLQEVAAAAPFFAVPDPIVDDLIEVGQCFEYIVGTLKRAVGCGRYGSA